MTVTKEKWFEPVAYLRPSGRKKLEALGTRFAFEEKEPFSTDAGPCSSGEFTTRAGISYWLVAMESWDRESGFDPERSYNEDHLTEVRADPRQFSTPRLALAALVTEAGLSSDDIVYSDWSWPEAILTRLKA
jgi:hypothetical protein